MHSILIFLAASLASFVGSLQLGPVNLFVIDTVLTRGKKNAFLVCVGGSLPEFIYCGLAVYSGNYFLMHPRILFIFKIILISVLIIVSIIYLFKKHKVIIVPSNLKSTNKSNTTSFLKGFTLAILNPQLLPFWMFVMVYFNSISVLMLKTKFDNLAYIFGAGLGAFLLLITITLTLTKFKIINYLNNKYYNKAMAILFFIIAMQQFFTLL